MILSDKYKKAMDNISLTDEQKQEIIQNAKKKKFDYRIIVKYRCLFGCSCCSVRCFTE